MLAVFTKIMNSKKLSGPRLEINLKGITRNSDCCCERIANNKRVIDRNRVMLKEKEAKSIRCWILLQLESKLNAYGLIETDEGLQYHPESVKEKPVKTKQGQENSTNDSNKSLKQKESVCIGSVLD